MELESRPVAIFDVMGKIAVSASMVTAIHHQSEAVDAATNPGHNAAGQENMNWKQSYYLKNYVRSSLWVVPFIAIPLELVATRILSQRV